MMNILIDKLPDTVVVSGFEIPINCDYRSGMRAHIALFDAEPTEADQIFLDAMYPQLPRYIDISDAFHAAAEFLMGAPVPILPGQKGKSKPPERAYSFLYDQEKIFAAFYQQYKIDLTKETMHWWVFHAMMHNLRGNHMADVMHMRTEQETAGMDDKERKRIRKNKSIWRLPEPVVDKKHKDDLIACLKNGGVGLEELLHGET